MSKVITNRYIAIIALAVIVIITAAVGVNQYSNGLKLKEAARIKIQAEATSAQSQCTGTTVNKKEEADSCLYMGCNNSYGS